MYKIYVNETKVLLLHSDDIPEKLNFDETHLIARYSGKSRHILNFIDKFEKSPIINSLILHYDDYDKLYDDFTKLFTPVVAAGGLVVNEKGEILFIYRRGSWDLPKGKLNKDEKKQKAAVREVEEETRIKGALIEEKLTITYHTFRNRSQNRAIKISHWYLMTAKSQKLVPQKEEDIEKAEWMTLETFFSKKRKVYANIIDVLNIYKNKINESKYVKG